MKFLDIKLKFESKIQILVQKLKFSPKIVILVKHLNFGQKRAFMHVQSEGLWIFTNKENIFFQIFPKTIL